MAGHDRAAALDIDVDVACPSALDDIVELVESGCASACDGVVEPHEWPHLVKRMDVRQHARLAAWLGCGGVVTTRHLVQAHDPVGRPMEPCQLAAVTASDASNDPERWSIEPSRKSADGGFSPGVCRERSEGATGELLHYQCRLDLGSTRFGEMATLMLWNAAYLGPYGSLAAERSREQLAMTYVWDCRLELLDGVLVVVAEVGPGDVDRLRGLVREVLSESTVDKVPVPRLERARGVARIILQRSWLDASSALSFAGGLHGLADPPRHFGIDELKELLRGIDGVRREELLAVARRIERSAETTFEIVR
ncbi:hypothetical protein [Nocardioides zeae]|uniref:Insulinase family protein n=1 Tax=Nocardioides zeae TaxID=1457234 RepID=A0A6P0HMF6_9ACTN|nr:hypothetical protein [Nocardioides zeae]NEN79776.1 hypothetical protein [Nocardioides zeae]